MQGLVSLYLRRSAGGHLQAGNRIRALLHGANHRIFGQAQRIRWSTASGLDVVTDGRGQVWP